MCNFEGCDKPHKGLGLCLGHYFQHKRGLELTPLRASRLVQERDETGKVCRACDTHKPYEDFHVKKASKDGRQSKCKECQKQVVSKARKQLANAN